MLRIDVSPLACAISQQQQVRRSSRAVGTAGRARLLVEEAAPLTPRERRGRRHLCYIDPMRAPLLFLVTSVLQRPRRSRDLSVPATPHRTQTAAPRRFFLFPLALTNSLDDDIQRHTLPPPRGQTRDRRRRTGHHVLPPQKHLIPSPDRCTAVDLIPNPHEHHTPGRQGCRLLGVIGPARSTIRWRPRTAGLK